MGGPTRALNGMLVCDNVITDRKTGKNSLIGIFDRILARSLPAAHPALSVYAKITDAQGEYTFRLELVDLSNGQIIGEGRTPPVQVPDRMVAHELVFNLQNLTFRADGRYKFRLYADEQFIGHHSFDVRLIARGGGPS